MVFKRFKEMLGGKVRLIMTGSSSINDETLDFLKVCFSVPILEGYGMVESSGVSCLTSILDSKSG